MGSNWKLQQQKVKYSIDISFSDEAPKFLIGFFLLKVQFT